MCSQGIISASWKDLPESAYSARFRLLIPTQGGPRNYRPLCPGLGGRLRPDWMAGLSGIHIFGWAGNQGEVEKGLAHLKSVEIFRIWKVFGRLISS